jgi:hypothetical protein
MPHTLIIDGLQVTEVSDQAKAAIEKLQGQVKRRRRARREGRRRLAKLTTDKATLEAKVTTLEQQVKDAKLTPAAAARCRQGIRPDGRDREEAGAGLTSTTAWTRPRSSARRLRQARRCREGLERRADRGPSTRSLASHRHQRRSGPQRPVGRRRERRRRQGRIRSSPATSSSPNLARCLQNPGKRRRLRSRHMAITVQSTYATHRRSALRACSPTARRRTASAAPSRTRPASRSARRPSAAPAITASPLTPAAATFMGIVIADAGQVPGVGETADTIAQYQTVSLLNEGVIYVSARSRLPTAIRPTSPARRDHQRLNDIEHRHPGEVRRHHRAPASFRSASSATAPKGA